MKIRNVAGSGREVESRDAILEINVIETGLEGPGIEVIDKIGATSQTGQQVVVKSTARRRLSTAPSPAELRGFRGSKIFSTKSAVRDAGEPNHCNITGGASVWFVYQGVTNAVMRFTTEGSDYDTVLAVYTGPSSAYSTMQPVTCDNDSGADGKTSVVQFPTARGATYYIAIDGVEGTKGLVRFKYEVAAPPVVSQAPSWGKVDPLTCLPLDNSINPRISLGDSVKFLVSAANVLAPVDLTYQWRLNGLEIPGAKESALCLRTLTTYDAGDYAVVVGNFSGSVTSAPVRLDFSQPAALLATLENQSVVAGGTTRFTVLANGNGPFGYRWSFNGAPLTGETNATLVLANVQRSQAGEYAVEVSNASGMVMSQAVLTVDEPPVILAQPQSQTVRLRSAANFSVQARGTEPLTYQWRLNGLLLPGATNAMLVVTNVTAADAGEYSVLVQNRIGSVFSAPATLTLQTPPRIVQQLVERAAPIGATVSFSVVAEGTAPLAYQWRFNGMAILGATNATYTLRDVQRSQEGRYQVLVSNAAGGANSQSARLCVLETAKSAHILSIAMQPDRTSRVLICGLGGTPAFLQASTDFKVWTFLTNFTFRSDNLYEYFDSEAPKYPWRYYQVAPLMAIKLAEQPSDQAVPVGGSVTLAASAEGTVPFSYQWRHNGVILPGATNTTLILTNVQTAQAGLYQVRVTNLVSKVMSQEAALCVLGPGHELQILSVKLLTNGTVSRVLICGPAETNGVLQATTDPGSETWTFLTNFTIGGNNLHEYLDTEAGQYPRRVYKVAPLRKLRITEQPQDQAEKPGTSAKFSVAVEGAQPWRYQWRHNGQELAGATDAVLSLTNVQAHHAGSYQVRVSGPTGSILSAATQLCVVTDRTVKILSTTLLDDRSAARLLICGPVGHSYQLEASENLSSWTALTNLTLAKNLYEFFDREAARHPWRFYKLALPPLKLGQVTRLADGTIEAALEGSVSEVNSYEGLNGTVQASSDLKNWVSVGVRKITEGKIRFSDPQAVGASERFYQVVPGR